MLVPVIIVGTIGLICSIILSIAAKVMAVPTDERFDMIREVLPGANCGACGYVGCDDYAKALADGSQDNPKLCPVGRQAVADKLAEILTSISAAK